MFDLLYQEMEKRKPHKISLSELKEQRKEKRKGFRINIRAVQNILRKNFLHEKERNKKRLLPHRQGERKRRLQSRQHTGSNKHAKPPEVLDTFSFRIQPS